MRTVIIAITYDADIDFSTAEALADSMEDGEGVAMVTVQLAHAPVVRFPGKEEIDDGADGLGHPGGYTPQGD